MYAKIPVEIVTVGTRRASTYQPVTRKYQT